MPQTDSPEAVLDRIRDALGRTFDSGAAWRLERTPKGRAVVTLDHRGQEAAFTFFLDESTGELICAAKAGENVAYMTLAPSEDGARVTPLAGFVREAPVLN